MQIFYQHLEVNLEMYLPYNIYASLNSVHCELQCADLSAMYTAHCAILSAVLVIQLLTHLPADSSNGQILCPLSSLKVFRNSRGVSLLPLIR